MKIGNMRKIFGERSFLLLTGLLCCMNQLVFVHAIPTFQYVSILLALWAIPLLCKKVFIDTESTFSNTMYTAGVMLAVTALLSFFANGLAEPLRNLCGVAAIAINFLLILQSEAFDNKRYFKTLLTTFFVITVVFGLVGIVLLYFRISVAYPIAAYPHWLGIDQYTMRYCGVTGNSNSMSRFMHAGFLCGIPLLFLCKKKVSKGFTWAGLAILLYNMLLTESRGTIYSIYAGIFAVAVVWALCSSDSFKKCLKNLAIGLLTAVLTVALLMGVHYVAVHYVPDLHSIQVGIGIDDDNSKDKDWEINRDNANYSGDFSNGRGELWRLGITATIDRHPLLGFSYANMGNGLREYVEETDYPLSTDYVKNILDHLHNQFVQSFAHFGLLGLLLIVGVYFYFAKLTVKILLQKKKKMADKKMFLWIVFSVSTIAIYSMVESIFFFSFDNTLINFIMFFVLGIYISFAKENYGDEILHDKVLDMFSKWVLALIQFIKRPFIKKTA